MSANNVGENSPPPGDYSPPPHVRDCEPLGVPPELSRRFIVRRLREAAEEFRAMEIQLAALERERVAAALSCIGRTGLDYVREDARHRHAITAIQAISGYRGAESTLVTECGKRLIEAHKHGLVPAQHHELAELIAYHRQPLRPPPEGFKGVRVPPHPAHLFDDVCGGRRFRMVREGDGRFRPGAEFGGLMPRWDASHLKLTKLGRYAATCESLADLIEVGPTAKPELGPKQFDFGNGEVGDGFSDAEKELLKIVLEAGHGGISELDAAAKLRIKVGAVQQRAKRTQDRMLKNKPPLTQHLYTQNRKLVIISITPTKR